MSTPVFQGPQLKSFILRHHALKLSASCTATTWAWTTRLPVSLQTTIISRMDYCNNLMDLLALPYLCLFTIFSQCNSPRDPVKKKKKKRSHEYPVIASVSVMGKPKSLDFGLQGLRWSGPLHCSGLISYYVQNLPCSCHSNTWVSLLLLAHASTPPAQDLCTHNSSSCITVSPTICMAQSFISCRNFLKCHSLKLQPLFPHQ